MDKSKMMVFLLPTNEPDTFNKYFMKGLKFITSFKDYCTFNINFQRPWTDEQINEVVDKFNEYGLNLNYRVSPKYKFDKPWVPFNQIRNDSIIDYDGMYYALLDDDMEFKGKTDLVKKDAGQNYLEALYYLLDNPNCGILDMGGTRVSRVPKYSIRMEEPNNPFLYSTSNGYILKRIQSLDKYKDNVSPVIPDDTLKLFGGAEERLIASVRLHEGMTVARMAKSKTAHHNDFQRVGSTYVSGSDGVDWTNKEVLKSGNFGYISKLNFPLKSYDKLNLWSVIIDPAIYEQALGYEITEDTLVKSNQDFSDINEDQIKEMIEDKLNE